jgi:DNA-binding LacI/PurR family transcriptional regulator
MNVRHTNDAESPARSTSPARPTASDVARRAGVSRTTVSFVLNDHMSRRGISNGTAERVRAAATELGYLPHKAARILQSGRSNLVVFIIPAGTSLGILSGAAVARITVELAPHGLDLVTRRATDAPLESSWRDLSPVAVIGLGFTPADVALMERDGVTAIDLDPTNADHAAGVLQAGHLMNRGYSTLAYGAPVDVELSMFANRRLAGVRDECARSGAPEPVLVQIELDLQEAIQTVERLRTEHPEVTGICAFNDEHAFAILGAMAQLGLTAPTDLAVIGVDNIPLSALAVPPLSTIAFDEQALQIAVMERLQNRHTTVRPTEPVTAISSPRVIPRRTT